VGQSLSPDGRHLGVVTKLEYFISHAGWSQTTRKSFVDGYATGPHMPADPALRVEMLGRSLVPLILAQGIATKTEVDAVLKQAVLEVGREDFCGLVFFLTVGGRKVV
jgi:hypothetical protein